MPIRIGAGPDGRLKAALVDDDGNPLPWPDRSEDEAETPDGLAELAARFWQEKEGFSGAAAVAAQILKDQSNSGAAYAQVMDAAKPQVPLISHALPAIRKAERRAAENAWHPRRPFVRGQKLALDDDGFADLGNAVLAAWLIQIPRRVRLWERERAEEGWASRPRAEFDQEMIEVGERTELRDLLDHVGALDDAINGPFRIDDDYPPEKLRDVYRRWEQALRSAETFAVVAVKDIAFPAASDLPRTLREALAALTPWERHTPIARLGPCPITRELRQLVMAFFRGEPLASPALDAEQYAAESPTSKRDRDERFIAEGLGWIDQGRLANGNAAAEALVALHGVSHIPVEVAQRGCIHANSKVAATKRLGEKINRALKQRLNG